MVEIWIGWAGSERMNIYKVDYDGSARMQWTVNGPGMYLQFGDDRFKAYEVAAALNGAFILGYMTATGPVQNV